MHVNKVLASLALTSGKGCLCCKPRGHWQVTGGAILFNLNVLTCPLSYALLRHTSYAHRRRTLRRQFACTSA